MVWFFATQCTGFKSETTKLEFCCSKRILKSWTRSDVYWTVHHCDSWRIKNQLDVTCYFISYRLIMFRTLLCPSSGSIRVAGWSYASACNPDTTQTEPQPTSNTQQTKNDTTNVVIQQHSRKFLMMDITMSETCWVYKK